MVNLCAGLGGRTKFFRNGKNWKIAKLGKFLSYQWSMSALRGAGQITKTEFLELYHKSISQDQINSSIFYSNTQKSKLRVHFHKIWVLRQISLKKNLYLIFVYLILRFTYFSRGEPLLSLSGYNFILSRYSSLKYRQFILLSKLGIFI